MRVGAGGEPRVCCVKQHCIPMCVHTHEDVSACLADGMPELGTPIGLGNERGSWCVVCFSVVLLKSASCIPFECQAQGIERVLAQRYLQSNYIRCETDTGPADALWCPTSMEEHTSWQTAGEAEIRERWLLPGSR